MHETLPSPDAAPPRHDPVTDENIRRYTRMESRKVFRHLRELEREWDTEAALVLPVCALTLAGTALGVAGKRKWFLLPLAAGLVMLQHRLKGSRLPQQMLRHFGFRPRREIDMEKRVLNAHLIPLD